MFLKIRRDTLVILLLAFMLIVSGRLMTYMAYASDTKESEGVAISGVIVKGNDIVPITSIRANVAGSGFRTGSYIRGDILVTSQRELPLNEAIDNAEEAAARTTIPGTSVSPIVAADIQVNLETGIVTVTVIEDFSTIQVRRA